MPFYKTCDSKRQSSIPAKKKEQHDGYIELEQTEHSLFGGSTCQVKFEPFIQRFKRDTLWICPVALFVLGHYPKYIYERAYAYKDLHITVTFFHKENGLSLTLTVGFPPRMRTWDVIDVRMKQVPVPYALDLTCLGEEKKKYYKYLEEKIFFFIFANERKQVPPAEMKE